jgi:hypothetical protein
MEENQNIPVQNESSVAKTLHIKLKKPLKFNISTVFFMYNTTTLLFKTLTFKLLQSKSIVSCLKSNNL